MLNPVVLLLNKALYEFVKDKYTLEDLLAGFIASIIEKLTDIEKYSLQAKTDNLSPDSLREEMKQLQDQISNLKKRLTEIELKG